MKGVSDAVPLAPWADTVSVGLYFFFGEVYSYGLPPPPPQNPIGCVWGVTCRRSRMSVLFRFAKVIPVTLRLNLFFVLRTRAICPKA